MKLRQKMNAVASIAGLLLCASAQAQWYVGASGGSQSARIDGRPCGTPGFNCRNSNAVGMVKLGYTLHVPVDSVYSQIGSTSIELGYARFGTLRTRGPLPPLGEASWVDKLSAVSFGTAYELHLNPTVSFTTRLGIARFKAVEEVDDGAIGAGLGVASRRDTSLYYSVGAVYRLTSKVALTGDLLFSSAPYAGNSRRDIHALFGGMAYRY